MNGACYGIDSAFKSIFIASLYEHAAFGGDVFADTAYAGTNNRQAACKGFYNNTR